MLLVQVEEQREEGQGEEDDGAQLNGMSWTDGAVASEGGPAVDEATKRMLQAQRQYYDMVHSVKVRTSCIWMK